MEEQEKKGAQIKKRVEKEVKRENRLKKRTVRRQKKSSKETKDRMTKYEDLPNRRAGGGKEENKKGGWKAEWMEKGNTEGGSKERYEGEERRRKGKRGVKQ